MWFSKFSEIFQNKSVVSKFSFQFIFTQLKLFKVMVHHFRKIKGCLDGHKFSSLVLVFISLCLEPVDLMKNINLLKGLIKLCGYTHVYIQYLHVYLCKKRSLEVDISIIQDLYWHYLNWVVYALSEEKRIYTLSNPI